MSDTIPTPTNVPTPAPTQITPPSMQPSRETTVGDLPDLPLHDATKTVVIPAPSNLEVPLPDDRDGD